MPDRRSFIKRASAVAGAAVLAPRVAARARVSGPAHYACNGYTWRTYFGRAGRDFTADLDAGLAEVAAAGLDGFEPLLERPADVERLAPLLKKHGLAMRSAYVNTRLHEAGEAEASIQDVLAIAEVAQARTGLTILVTNPSPIRWGGPENKTDEQLRTQADALGRLGAALAARGITLSYHTHDPEFRAGAREFHHMMLATDPAHVTFCCDAHWVFRGAEDSQVALFDVLKLYGDRITELHIRQSRGGTWTETLGEGDIDYPRFVDALLGMGVRPHVVLEQAPEEGTPHTMSALEAHQESFHYLREVFAPLMG